MKRIKHRTYFQQDNFNREVQLMGSSPSPWGCNESDTTEQFLFLSFFLSIVPMEKEMATHSSVLAWRIPGTGEPGGLPSMGSQRVGHDWSDLAAAAAGLNEDIIPWSKQLFLYLWQFITFIVYWLFLFWVMFQAVSIGIITGESHTGQYYIGLFAKIGMIAT